MDKKNVLDIISRFRTALEKNGIKIGKIILYGSWSKNSYSESSDIDLVVLSEEFASKDYWERIDILTAAIHEIFEPIEAVAMTPEEFENGDSFIGMFAKDGEIVYGQS
ncbi:MAG: nucleotidyltransferase domain-containing protein [bacterium]